MWILTIILHSIYISYIILFKVENPIIVLRSPHKIRARVIKWLMKLCKMQTYTGYTYLFLFQFFFGKKPSIPIYYSPFTYLNRYSIVTPTCPDFHLDHTIINTQGPWTMQFAHSNIFISKCWLWHFDNFDNKLSQAEKFNIHILKKIVPRSLKIPPVSVSSLYRSIRFGGVLLFISFNHVVSISVGGFEEKWLFRSFIFSLGQGAKGRHIENFK